MARTVVARFDRPDDAERAIVQLDAAGYERVSVSVTRGGALVSAIVSDSRGDEAVGVLQQSGAVELDTRPGAWRATGWREYEPFPTAPG